MINILIVEDEIDHQFYFKTVIESQSDIHNLGIIGTGKEAIKYIETNLPQVVLIDLGLPDMSGIDCILHIKATHPQIHFLVCTIHEEDEKVFEALQAGASGYILKKSKPYQIIDAIKQTIEGETPISPAIASKILVHIKAKEDKIENEAELYNLTFKQIEILNELAKGASYIEVADTLFISVKTLKWHVNKIYKKLQAGNRTEALNKFFKRSQ